MNKSSGKRKLYSLKWDSKLWQIHFLIFGPPNFQAETPENFQENMAKGMMQRSERQTAEANDLDIDITTDHLQRLTNLYQHYILKTSSWDELTVDHGFLYDLISIQFSSSHLSQSRKS